MAAFEPLLPLANLRPTTFRKLLDYERAVAREATEQRRAIKIPCVAIDNLDGAISLACRIDWRPKTAWLQNVVDECEMMVVEPASVDI